ncbi:PREDICTED: IQ domain-containing protein G isoform X1 [Papilio xuthus]|uniref:Dynein regulatory complex protein 9 n=1 Tax=Papilio xuthus TaxID=66420 RepID=A0AAJ6ZE91_PAPXU|nr:PREDICTED: IQ domain-containing protein G isoform X1 [Papilio xuthus]
MNPYNRRGSSNDMEDWDVINVVKIKSNVLSQSRTNKIEEDSEGEGNFNKNADELPFTTACLFATILEDSITTMRILAQCNNALRVAKAMADMGDLLAIKFSVPPAQNIDPLGKINPNDLGREEYKLDKLEADRNFLLDVLTSTYADLSLERDFKSLVEHSARMVEREEYYLTLLEDEARNRATRRDLNRQIRQQRVHVKTVTYDTDVVIDKLKTQVEDAALNAEIQTRYIVNWQRARTEQHEQSIADRERPPASEIETHKQRLDHEQRVHTEFELLNNIIINETLEKVESWMNKYDTDMEGIDLKIQIKRSDYETTLENRQKLEDTLEKHDKLMKDWVNFKEEREKARQYREKMFNAAVVVQAWWRGLLVRQKLGPFKEVKKKPPPKKK